MSRKLRVVLLAGLPRSGKTRLALRLRELGWDHLQHHAEANIESLKSAMRASLEAGRDVVVDSTNLSSADRLHWWTVAQQTLPSAVDGSGGVSQYVVICAMIPTGEDAAQLDPALLQYRQQYLSPHYTSALPADKVVEYIHNVIAALDPSFDVPYTTEGIDSLAHVRTQDEFEQVAHGVAQPTVSGRPRLPAAMLPPAASASAAAVALPMTLGASAGMASSNLDDTEATLYRSDAQPVSSAMGANGAGIATMGGYQQAAQPGAYTSDPALGATPYGAMGGTQPTYGAGMGLGRGGPMQQAGHGAATNGGMQPPGLTGFNGGYNGGHGAQQLAGDRWPGAMPGVQVKQEFDAQPNKRPYEHGPGASQSWGTPEVKRQASGGPNAPGSSYMSAEPQGMGLPGLQVFHQGAFAGGGHTPGAFAGGGHSQGQAPGGFGVPAGLQQPLQGMQGMAGMAMLPQHGPLQHALPQHGVAAGHLQHGMLQGHQMLGAGPMQRGMPHGGPSAPRDGRSSSAFNGLREQQEPSRAGPPQPVDVSMADPRPILLFELSGVLCNATKDRMATRTRNHLPRPGLRHLARLMPHFRLGVYSTAIKKTVLAALAVVSSAIRGELASSADGWQMLLGGTPPPGAAAEASEGAALVVPPEYAGLPRVGLTAADISGSLKWSTVFEEALVLHREHTDVTLIEDREITVKAVKTLFPHPDMQRRILVVDEPHFSRQDDNFVAVKKWEQENRGDSQLAALVEALLAHLPAAGGDVRTIARKVSQDVRTAAGITVPLPLFKATESDEGYYEDYPQQPGSELCTFYLETGHCRFGEGCHFHHPPENRVKLNRGGFPMHPGKLVCAAYLNTGFCDYGKACVKHHPNLEVIPGSAQPVSTGPTTQAVPQVAGSIFRVVQEDWTKNFPQREGEQVCTHFAQTGACRFGASCKYHHPLDGPMPPLNNYGLPMRLEGPVCEFFCKTGACRFGTKCKKHHPNLIPGPQERDHFAEVPMGGNLPRGSGHGMRNDVRGVRGEPARFEVIESADGFFAEFMRNPGKEVCPNYRRTGHCKFGPTCKYDHPLQYAVKLNLVGLPMRPGAEVCRFFMTTGECGFGRQCMLHHPNIAPLGMVAGGPAFPGEAPWGGPTPIHPGNAFTPGSAFHGPSDGPGFMGGPQAMVIVPPQQAFMPHW